MADATERKVKTPRMKYKGGISRRSWKTVSGGTFHPKIRAMVVRSLVFTCDYMDVLCKQLIFF